MKRNQNCCAHCKVSIRHTDHSDGTRSDYWECDSGCGQRFQPITTTETVQTPSAATSDEVLLPCPYCGAKAYINPSNERRDGYPVRDYLQCSGCNAMMCRRRSNPGEADRENLLSRWNRRTPFTSEPTRQEWLNEFHRLNVARQHEAFAPAHSLQGLVNCVTEEIGELAGAVNGVTGEKKRKSHLTNDDILDAVADAITYLSLVADRAGCSDLAGLIATTFNMVSDRAGSSLKVRLPTAFHRPQNTTETAPESGKTDEEIARKRLVRILDFIDSLSVKQSKKNDNALGLKSEAIDARAALRQSHRESDALREENAVLKSQIEKITTPCSNRRV